MRTRICCLKFELRSIEAQLSQRHCEEPFATKQSTFGTGGAVKWIASLRSQ